MIAVKTMEEYQPKGKWDWISKIWQTLFKTVSSKDFVKAVSRYESRVIHFVEWLMGASYSLDEFLTTTESYILPHPLWSLVYQFLSPPSWIIVKQEIISLI